MLFNWIPLVQKLPLAIAIVAIMAKIAILAILAMAIEINNMVTLGPV